VTEQMLRDIFDEYGEIELVLIGKKKRDAVISYANVDSAVSVTCDTVTHSACCAEISC
jgi:hypothetical protein